MSALEDHSCPHAMLGLDPVFSGLPRRNKYLATLTFGLRCSQSNNFIQDLDANFCSRISAYRDHLVEFIQRCCLYLFRFYSDVSMSPSLTLTIGPLVLRSLPFTSIELQHIQILAVYFILLTFLFFQHYSYLP